MLLLVFPVIGMLQALFLAVRIMGFINLLMEEQTGLNSMLQLTIQINQLILSILKLAQQTTQFGFHQLEIFLEMVVVVFGNLMNQEIILLRNIKLILRQNLAERRLKLQVLTLCG